MVTVTVSPKFQVVIPKDIRNQLELKPGQKLQILNYGDRIEFLPIKEIKKLKGFLKGIDTSITREKDRI
ncbi:MAG: AbrB/MazE/SpoVT family DNA-binding domain-containing protein [Candidatus Marinimicrobia bacterium]|nr:AbrB/MazE/SpoVT family DNA-binding domain-containing protein [Candidatus Neomarinimicrobiota bacterium]